MRAANLPRWDWLLLPAIGLATMLLVVECVSFVAGRMFGAAPTTLQQCLIMNDRSTGTRAIPNTTCSDKVPESELVDYSFNNCGHRSAIDCGPKLPGVYRIVAVGSSYGFGAYVRSEQSFVSLLSAELSQRTGRRIEVYNENMLAGWPRSAGLRMDDVFAMQPDMILWTFTPFDLQAASAVLPSDLGLAGALPDAVVQKGFFAKTWYRITFSFATHSVPNAIAELVAYLWRIAVQTCSTSSTAVLLQHIVHASQRDYVDAYLRGPDYEVGFLRVDPSAAWRTNLKSFDSDADLIVGRARAEGVPLVAALLPNRAQAAMISMRVWPKGFDPYQVVDQLRSIIVGHGGTYVNILPDFLGIPNPERGYLPVDGHPNAQGHAMFSELLAKELTNGAVPAVKAAGK
jgi:hypothetical protein